MKKGIISLILFFVLFAFAGCHKIYRKQQVLQDIDESTFEPQAVFVYENNLYLQYEYENEKFFLYAKIHKQGSGKSKKNSVIEAEIMQNISDDEAKKAQRVLLVKNILSEASEEVMMSFAPKDKNKAVMLLTGFKDIILYRGGGDEIKVCDLANLPEGIEVSHKIDKKTIRKNTYYKIIEILKKRYPHETRFVLQTDTIHLVPYIYVDISKEIAAAIKLPDYYQVRKETSPLGFSVELFYSFFIKSHIFALIKSPFTSFHRLFSTTVYSLYTGLSPNIENIKGEIPPLNTSGEMMDIKAFDKYLDRYIDDKKYKGRARILIDGGAFFSEVTKRFATASEKIDIRMYIFKPDPYSITIADLLKAKSNEGVKVKIILDEINAVLNWTKAPERLHSRDFVMPGIKKYLKKDSKIKLRTKLNTWANTDHCKVIIIDEKTAYTGGMNFGEEYRYFWHDMMFELEGPIVRKLKDDFRQTWVFTGLGGDFSAAARAVFKKKDDYQKDVEPGMYEIRLLHTKPSSAQIFAAQLEAIKRAKSRIYIENAYFSDIRILQELINARARGVDVRVILPAENDNGIMDRNNIVKANIMFHNGIRVYFYPRMSHIKAGVYDNWACVGSANFDKFSLYVNRELDIASSEPKFVEDLVNKLFMKDFAESKEVTEELDTSVADYLMSSLAAQG